MPRKRVGKGQKYGPEHHCWKGGRRTTAFGYVEIYVGAGHHLAMRGGAYAFEHRVAAEQKLGRRLMPGEVVHHINGVKSDNRQENLMVCESQAHHEALHHGTSERRRKPGEDNPMVPCACGCGELRPKFNSAGVRCRYIRFHHWRKGSGAEPKYRYVGRPKVSLPPQGGGS